MREKEQVIILGAGMTGLAAGYANSFPIYETEDHPGGICSSYYVKPGSSGRLAEAPEDGEAYRFEIGGGHWIFGGDEETIDFIKSLVPVKTYRRRAAVFFCRKGEFVPYPIQNHLRFLGYERAKQIIKEIKSSSSEIPRTMSEWLEKNFGSTLTSLFFGPFHEMYTAGLYRCIAPQDAYKSPVDLKTVIQGATQDTPPVGYNADFLYPQQGLNTLSRRMAEGAIVHYSKRVVKIDTAGQKVYFSDNTSQQYDRIISTLPLNKMMELTALEVEEKPDPYSSVLELNIGARRGSTCPDQHWVYIPDSISGFFRVGFYSNVDTSFLPSSCRGKNNSVGIYVEKAYPGGNRPDKEEVISYQAAVVKELQNWGWIGEVEACDSTWIDVAYTWSWPGNLWKQKALQALREYGIIQVGRYARWGFHGLAVSIRDGRSATADLNAMS